MRFLAGAWILSAAAASLGCVQPPMSNGQLASLDQQNAATQQRFNELQARAAALDRDHQEQSRLLAQEQQLRRVSEDQTAALREQLGTVAEQLVRLKEDHLASAAPAQTKSASLRTNRGDAAESEADVDVGSNNQPPRLPVVEIAGAKVRSDGDVIRVELPAGTLFEPGGARLLPQAASVVQGVADQLARAYPDQIIGVEGHTDSGPIANRNWNSNHQLSVGWAMAVYDLLAAGRRMQPGQLFVAGHGANHPVVSNGTTAGQERNRRVELVVYPERVAAATGRG